MNDLRRTSDHVCPRREEDGHEGVDQWREGDTCSYCGSMNPDRFMEEAEKGTKLIPTDKKYKVYVGDHRKFYFQHLRKEQQERFIELVNAGTLVIGYPGYFYVLPFFTKGVGR